MSEENLQESNPVEEAKEQKSEEGRDTPGRMSETCICGHRASKHTANRYACQAPGSRKGYCPCMRFVARNSPIGKRLQSAGRPKKAAAEDAE